MERTDLRKILAGFGLATLLAGVALSGCSGSQKSAGGEGASGDGGAGKRQQGPAPSS